VSSAERAFPRVTVVGEALIDLVPGPGEATFRARPGGSPYNVAVGLARLGVQTSLMARLADNTFGRVLAARARREGVDLSGAPLAREATTLAVVSLAAEGQVNYDFYVEGTADWQWTAAELGDLPNRTAILHFGSIAAWTAPGADHIQALARRTAASGEILVSYDPNVRPSLLGDRDGGRAAIEGCVRSSHLTKASRDDLEWLYPGQSVADVAAGWLSSGPGLVIVTDGASGATAFTRTGERLHCPGMAVDVVDTVGAGDAFNSGLLAALLAADLASPSALADARASQLREVLDQAICVSALACTRAGAEPPDRAELLHAQGVDPPGPSPGGGSQSGLDRS
jgi:fructokinase